MQLLLLFQVLLGLAFSDKLLGGHRRDCSPKAAKSHCSLKTKICSAWSDSYYRTFDGRDFVLLGNCNYTFVQTTCPGLNATVPLQIKIARAYLNSPSVSTIHTVQISIQDLTISIVKEEKNHIRVDGQKRNLPLSLQNGSLNFYPSGSNVILETSFGLTLLYDWIHHVQVEVGPELYGAVCGLCGDAKDGPLGSSIATNDTETVKFTLPWVLGSGLNSCNEDCVGSTCPLCTQSQTITYPGVKGNSYGTDCSLLSRNGGPFADCHAYVDPAPFERSCVNQQCIGEAASLCKVLRAYATICQMFGARVQNWRSIMKCSMTCPINSHYEVCGSACPATCGNPVANHNCSLPCVESCQCNRGYLLSGGKCVAHTNCGCSHNGSYYLPKESFWMGQQCQEKCVCLPHSKKVACAVSHCRAGEVCKVLNGVLGCYMDEPGLCIAKGTRHYTTFDGRNFDIHGNCSYLLTSHCPTWGDLNDFTVEVHNKINEATNVSSWDVKIVVFGYVIVLSSEWNNRVKINGLLLRVPLVLSKGKVKLFMAGHGTRVETDFGVVVTYSSDILTVQMPRIFSSSLCGLCGNFNGNPDDDPMQDDETDLSHAVRQWRLGRQCMDMPMNTPSCDPQEIALYRGNDFCGRLVDTEGAFQSCHEAVDPQTFYDNCIYDLCNDHKTLCQILSRYVAICQEKGSIVDEWRDSNFCALSCQANSEYQLCSQHRSDCVETPHLLPAKCREGCFCKPGFFHSGGQCIPNSECGCIYNDVYYEIHETFHPDEHCQLYCACTGHNQLQCTEHTCPVGTNCAVQDGVRACHASEPLLCRVMGGRHFRTYDAQTFDFNMGTCRYVLSRTCDDESGPTVVVQKDQVDLSVYGVTISLEMEHLGKIKVNGVLWRLPVQLDHIAILNSGLLTRVVVDTGVIVTYGWPKLIQIEIPASGGKMCGLCGNSTASTAGNEQLSLNGSLANNSMLASSWSLSPPGENCTEKCGNCTVCNSTMAAEFASHGSCGMVLAPVGPFSNCHATVDPEPYFQNCVTALCMSNNQSLCSSLSEYAFACQDAGAEVKPWRGDKCLLSCPEHSHYNVCVNSCAKSCGVISDIPCPWSCYEGCQCDSGYIRSGNGCVRAEQCGCFYNGHYYEIGEISWAEGCSQRCNCSAPATMCCEPASCPEGQSCTLNDTWGCSGKVISCPVNSHYVSCGTACPPTCEAPFNSRPCTLACVERCQCNQGFVLDGDTCVPLSQCGCTYNASHYHSNETFWADDACTEQCVCDVRTHQIQCYSASCGLDEYCGVQDGTRSCVVNPHKKSCFYTGNHVLTFDQRDYDFHGTCQYQLFGICGQRPDLIAIEVHVQTDGHLLSPLHVLVIVGGKLVELNSKNTENIEVNGIRKNLPYLLSPTALVFSLGLHTYIYMDHGFELSISIEGIVRIHLPSEYANATCGLCGNYNSDPADDLTVNGTKQSVGPEYFGKVWRSGLNPWCVEGCLGGSCPKCSSDHLARYSDPEACGKILEVNGPFRHCHGKVDPSSFYKRCVSDLCLHGDLQPAPCRSLAEYAAVCHSHKATVYAWRTPEFCHESCPSSTSYNTSSASVRLCLGWRNNTFKLPLNTGENCHCDAGLVHSGNLCVHPENCGCIYHGEYLQEGQEVSTCQKSCVCHSGGNMTCHNISCKEDEECKFIRGVQGCHPKVKVAYCSVDGSQYSTFDGQTFKFHGSCNYTLVGTCSVKKLDVEPVLITIEGSHHAGRQIHLQFNKMTFKMSAEFPGKILVNGVYENLPFSQNNVTVYQKNEWKILEIPESVELISNLHSHIQIKIFDIYHQTTCGLCGNYNDNQSDDMQLPDGTITSDPKIFGLSWKFPDGSSCSDTCDGVCQRCQTPMPEYTSDLYCGLVTKPNGPFSSCHHLVCSQKYHSLCLESLCMASGEKWALCSVLQAYETACERAGATVNLWRNITGCADQCPQFSHYSKCANICSSLCSGMSEIIQCPAACKEGCQCDDHHFYDGHACVPAAECGCVHEGRTLKANESRLLQNCTVNCTCGPPLVCEQYSCPPQHSCIISNGTAHCHKDEHKLDPCAGKCDESEKCSLRNGVPVCVSSHGVCWAWKSQQYSTFDGLRYGFDGTCTYLLTGSNGAARGLTPFMVSVKNNGTHTFAMQVVTVQVYGFIIKLDSKDGIYVNGQFSYVPLNLLQGKIQISIREGTVLLRTDFGMQVVYDRNATIIVTLDPHYKGNVYGLCGNFNGNPQEEYPGFPLNKTSVDLAHAYQLFDGDHNCCTGCKQNLDKIDLLSDSHMGIIPGHRKQCDVLKDLNGPYVNCQNQLDVHAFYQHCIMNLMNNGGSKVALDKSLTLYSLTCEGLTEYNSGLSVGVDCPPHSHYKTCGSACPPTCEFNSSARFCPKVCMEGCFCDPGFLMSPRGCVLPQQCGCKDSRGKYHSLNSTFWIPDKCGQVCVCGPAVGVVHCSPSPCPRGMVCNKLHHKRMCQPVKPLNCTVTTGLHFTTFDGHHFDFRGTCAYSLVHTHSDLIGLTPFNITISDANCYKRLYHSQTLTLSIYGVKVAVSEEHPEKVLVDGLYRHLPYSHKTAHIDIYHTASSLVVHVDIGLQLIVYKTGNLMVSMPISYNSSVAGLCGNANTNPYDDLMMSNDELAQNTQEFAYSWRLGGTEACESACYARLQHCPPEEEKLFEHRDFCGIIMDKLGPFADCTAVLNPESYFHNCVSDSCAYGGHNSALCNSIASYAAACQAAQLPIRHWRSDTFCGIVCPKNSHYELCGPRCPAVCAGLSSPANCSGGCEEGCQCDPGYVLSDGECVLISDCGCMHNGHYYPAGLYYSGKTCQKCKCKGTGTCSPSPCIPMEKYFVNANLDQPSSYHYGVCEVFSGFGYITFDGMILPHYGTCTYLLSQLSSKVMHDYSLLLSFEKSGDVFTISRVALQMLSVEVLIDPKAPWKIQVNGEQYMMPFDNGMLKVIQDGHRVVVTTVAGVQLEISSTQYLRLTVPQQYNSVASGICGNFNGDKLDDLEQSNVQLARSFSEFLHSWTVDPREHCTETCGKRCDQCSLPPQSFMACDILLVTTTEFRACRKSGVDHNIYRNMCITAVCSGAKRMEAACLALEAYAAACQVKGIKTGSWRKNTPCSLECPDRSSPSECVDSASSSCSALLQLWSPPAGCSSGCKCRNGNVFDGEDCVPYSQCGCVLHGRYIQPDEQLYNENCTQRCWCHPQGGVLCENAACSPGQSCVLRNGSWGCHDAQEVCQLKGSSKVTTLSGQHLNLESNLSYTLMSLCDETSEGWFHVISYHGPCEEGSAGLTTVFKILLPGTSIVIQRGTVKVNGLFVSLPHILPSGVSLTLGVTPDKEAMVIMRRDVLMKRELEIEMGVTMVTLKVTHWYSGKLCGLCGNMNDLHSEKSVKSWVLPDYDSCDN